MHPSTRRRARALVALVTGFLCGCDQLTGPSVPANATWFAPPPVYTRWWSMVETCSGVTSPMDNVNFFRVNGATHLTVEGREADGYWSPASNRIVLTGISSMEGGVVRHEMLHSLIRGQGHRREQFLGVCAGMVDCARPCVDDAGPVGTERPVRMIVPESLVVWTDITPSEPNRLLENGAFSVIVFAHNKYPEPVRVHVTRYSAGRAQGFGLTLANATVSLDAPVYPIIDSSSVWFQPGETKLQVFDFFMGADFFSGRPPPGVYQAIGSFGGYKPQARSFRLYPDGG